jgi:predicted PurR-regulated permease PerM
MIRGRYAMVPRQTAFWLFVAVAVLALLWLLRGMLLPFVLGMALAYVLDPVADRLERWGVPRWIATILGLSIFVGAFVALAILVVPLIETQIVQLVGQLPHYADLVRHKLLPAVTRIIGRVSGSADAEDVRKAASSYAGNLSTWVGQLLGQVWSSGLAIANVVYVMLLTPLVAFYFLRDWDRMIDRIDSWLPRRQADTIRELAREIDAILAGFVRGQAIVCFMLAVYYSVALSLAGLDYGIIIGIAAGVLTFIPYLGAIVGLIASIGVAFSQFDDYSRVVIVAAVYVFGHTVEANLITPNLVGDRVQLHPVWILFALLAGGALFGFTGVLLAVPIAAVIGVVVRFALKQYLASTYFDDRADHPPELVERLPSVDLGQL